MKSPTDSFLSKGFAFLSMAAVYRRPQSIRTNVFSGLVRTLAVKPHSVVASCCEDTSKLSTLIVISDLVFVQSLLGHPTHNAHLDRNLSQQFFDAGLRYQHNHGNRMERHSVPSHAQESACQHCPFPPRINRATSNYIADVPGRSGVAQCLQPHFFFGWRWRGREGAATLKEMRFNPQVGVWVCGFQVLGL